MIQGVIFDLGSTLIHFTGQWPDVFRDSLEVLVAQLKKEGLSLDDEVFIRIFREDLARYHHERDQDLLERTTEVILTEALEKLDVHSPSGRSIRLALEEMYKISERHWHPIPGAREVLDEIDARGLHMGMISNAGHEANVHRLIDMAGIRPYFDPILVSAGFGVRKPHPDIFRAALNRWGLPADQVVMVGDLLEADILGAERIGMRHIWMTEVIDRSTIEQAYPVQPDAIAESLAQVPDILQSFEEAERAS